ncbi:filamin-a [Plakobranchus ocellatus]|uniref:Filamin-a n=1 Tax=Plakobranchus ocellatus TaxID=259542 RepID=A0AAV3ZL04_9GAST|nr:filamin-a [Plakobranchus ocellatus]
MPSGNGLGPKVRDNSDGTICVEYEPRKEGMHEVLMSFDGLGVDAIPNILDIRARALKIAYRYSSTPEPGDGLSGD